MEVKVRPHSRTGNDLFTILMSYLVQDLMFHFLLDVYFVVVSIEFSHNTRSCNFCKSSNGNKLEVVTS